jgi:hypothetical protein
MSRKILLDAFYNQFSDFLDQLTKVFPGDTDFPTYKMGLLLLQRTNPILVVSEVHKHVAPFEEIIRAKNEDFFLKHEFSEYTSDDALEQIIMKLKGLWSTLTDNNKTCVWGYIILLMDLAKRYSAQPTR